MISPISLTGIVTLFLYLGAVVAVFGLLYFAIHFIGRKYPSEITTMVVNTADVILVVCGVLILIGFILHFAGVLTFAP